MSTKSNNNRPTVDVWEPPGEARTVGDLGAGPGDFAASRMELAYFSGAFRLRERETGGAG